MLYYVPLLNHGDGTEIRQDTTVVRLMSETPSLFFLRFTVKTYC
jgi:hypothetical protein